jgi:hypothetical protein
MVAARSAAADVPADAGADGGHSVLAREDLAIAFGVSSTALGSDMPGLQLGNTRTRTIDNAMAADSSLESTMLLSLRYRIGKRLLWSVPTLSFAYEGGSEGGTQWVPWGGLTNWGIGYSSIEHVIANGSAGAGIGLRQWLRSSLSLNATAGVMNQLAYTSKPICIDGEMTCGDRWTTPKPRGSATLGLSIRATPSLTFNLGVGASQRVDGEQTAIGFGSVQTIGLRVLPLVEAHLNRSWSIDGYANATYDPYGHGYEQTYLLGVTRSWVH